MTTNAETRHGQGVGSPEGSASGGSTTATVAQPRRGTQRSNLGDWPASPYTDVLLVRGARRTLTLDSIRADLEEQPFARAVRTSARRWITDLLALAKVVAAQKTESAR